MYYIDNEDITIHIYLYIHSLIGYCYWGWYITGYFFRKCVPLCRVNPHHRGPTNSKESKPGLFTYHVPKKHVRSIGCTTTVGFSYLKTLTKSLEHGFVWTTDWLMKNEYWIFTAPTIVNIREHPLTPLAWSGWVGSFLPAPYWHKVLHQSQQSFEIQYVYQLNQLWLFISMTSPWYFCNLSPPRRTLSIAFVLLFSVLYIIAGFSTVAIGPRWNGKRQIDGLKSSVGVRNVYILYIYMIVYNIFTHTHIKKIHSWHMCIHVY